MSSDRCPELPPTTEARIADNRAQTFADSVMSREALAAAAQAHTLAAAAALAPADVEPKFVFVGACLQQGSVALARQGVSPLRSGT